MKELLLKIKKRNERYNIAIMLNVMVLVAFMFSLLFYRESWSIPFIGLVAGFLLVAFVLITAKKDEKISIEDLRIIQEDKEFENFKPFLKPYIKNESDLNYVQILKAFADFQYEQDKPEDVAERERFVNELKGEQND